MDPQDQRPQAVPGLQFLHQSMDLVTLIAFMTGPFPLSRDEDMILASEILKKVGAPQTFYIYKCLCDYFDGLTDAEKNQICPSTDLNQVTNTYSQAVRELRARRLWVSYRLSAEAAVDHYGDVNEIPEDHFDIIGPIAKNRTLRCHQ